MRMRVKLTLAALLFLLPDNICGSKENKNSNIETENLPDIDISDELDIEYDKKTNGHAVKTVEKREAGELITMIMITSLRVVIHH